MAERKTWIERISAVSAVTASVAGLIAGVITFTTQKLTKIDLRGIAVAMPPPESAVSRKV